MLHWIASRIYKDLPCSYDKLTDKIIGSDPYKGVLNVPMRKAAKAAESLNRVVPEVARATVMPERHVAFRRNTGRASVVRERERRQ